MTGPVERRSLGCAGCGDCCNPVHISTIHADQMAAWWVYWENGGTVGSRGGRVKGFDMASIRFGAQHWTEINRRGDMAALRCDQYDPDTRRCLAYDDRPPVCSGFPWYGAVGPTERSERAQAANRRCSFLLDVPPEHRGPNARPLIPVTVAGAGGCAASCAGVGTVSTNRGQHGNHSESKK